MSVCALRSLALDASRGNARGVRRCTIQHSALRDSLGSPTAGSADGSKSEGEPVDSWTPEAGRLLQQAIAPTEDDSLVEAIHSIGNVRAALHRIHDLIRSMTKQLNRKVKDDSLDTTQPHPDLYGGETLDLESSRKNGRSDAQ